jgi:chemotaxis protein MotA
MDVLSLFGLLFGLIAILGGVVAKGSSVEALWNLAAFLIVVVGTLGATLVQTRVPVFLHAFRMFPWVFKPPRLEPKRMIKRIVEWSQLSRKEGLLGLEDRSNKEPDPFVRKGLQLLVDGAEPQTLRQILESDLDNSEPLISRGRASSRAWGSTRPRSASSARSWG